LGLLAALIGLAACSKRAPIPGAGGAARLAVISGRLISIPELPLTQAQARLDIDEGTASSDGNGVTSAPLTRVPMAQVTVSREGTFRIEKVPAGRYVLRGSAAGHADARVRFETTGGETVVTVLRLPRAETLAGRVVDRHARPVPAARVLLWTLAEGDRPKETASNADGGFSFAGLGRGQHRLLVQAPGFGPTSMGPVETPAANVVVVLEGDGRNIAGTVTQGGRPAAGALVLISGETLSPPRETTTTADGAFSIAGLGPGVYAVRAVLAGVASKTSGELVLGASPSGDRPQPVHLTLTPGWTLGGRVVDDRGKPVPGSDVRIDNVSDNENVPEVQRTDRDARWTSRALPAGEYRITPRRPGFVTRAPVQVVLGARAPNPQRSLTLELVRGAEMVGRVVDERGAALPNAIVRCLVPGRADLTVLVDPLPLAAEAAALPPGAGHALGRTRNVLTDSAGRFALPDLLPGRFRLDVSRGEYVSLRTGEWLLGPGQRVDVGSVTLRDGVRISGRVVDDNDTPIEGAQINARPADLKGVDSVVTLTDRAGQFGLAIPPGSYNLAVSAAGNIEQIVPLAIAGPGGAPSGPINIKLTRADSTLAGMVKDSGGRPVARAEVLAWATAPDAPAAAGQNPGASKRGPEQRPLSSTVTDPGGFFTLRRLPMRSIWIEIKHGEYPSVVMAATPGTFATVALPIPGRIVGAVHEKVTGAVIARYRVEAQGPDGRIAGGAARAGGFSLSRLVPGRWTITVQAPGYKAGEQSVDVPPSTTLGEPSVRDVRVELEKPR
jgi:protocatechuate 3,4-dioxygenase beta subunit